MARPVSLSSIGALFTWFALSSVTCRAGNADLEKVVARNKAALESIATLSCRINISSVPSSPMATMTARYSRSGNDVRVRWSLGDIEFDSMLKDGIVHSVSKAKGGERTLGTVGKHDGMPFGFCDVWHHAMLTLMKPGTATVLPLEQLVSDRGLTVTCRDVIPDRPYASVVVRAGSSTLELSLDPTANYLVRSSKYTVNEAKRSVRSEKEVLRFKEATPGVYLPEEIVARHHVDDKLISTQTAILSELRVNSRLPADTFDFRFPAGTTVNDMVEGKQYKVNAEGRPIGPISDVPRGSPLPAPVHPGTETKEEPVSWTTWILPASVGLLIIAGVAWLIARWRSHRSVRGPQGEEQ